MSEIIWYLSFSDWLLSFSRILSTSIHVVATTHVCILTLKLGVWCLILNDIFHWCYWENTKEKEKETEVQWNGMNSGFGVWEIWIKMTDFDKNIYHRGAWVAQSVKHLTPAQVTISQFMGSNPLSGSVLTARSLEPAPDSVSPSLSAPPPLMLCLSLSQNK